MNKTRYKLVFNERTKILVPVPESAKRVAVDAASPVVDLAQAAPRGTTVSRKVGKYLLAAGLGMICGSPAFAALSNAVATFNNSIDASCSYIEDPLTTSAVSQLLGTSTGACGPSSVGNSTNVFNQIHSNVGSTSLHFIANSAGVFVDGGLETFGANNYFHGQLSMWGNPVAQTTPNKIVGLANGTVSASSRDAVNGSQLFGLGSSMASALGGASTFDAATAAVNAQLAYAGNTYSSVQGALDAISAAATGGGIRYFHANSVLADSVAGGTDSVAVGPQAVTTAGAAGGVAIGNGANVANAGSVALGAGSVDSAVHTGTLALYGSTAAGVSGAVVSVGAAGAERQITNVGPGVIAAASTDAVNGSQLFGVAAGLDSLGASAAATLGGGSSYNAGTGTLTAALTYAGNTYNSVQGALDSIGAAVTGGGIRYFHSNSVLGDSVAGGMESVAIGPQSVTAAGAAGGVALGNGASVANAGSVALGAGSVDSAVHTGTLSAFGSPVAGAAPGSVVSVGATGAERQLTNVAAGVIGAGSTDAVNGSQLAGAIAGTNAQGNAVASLLGSGVSYDSATGALSGNFSFNGNTYGSVQGVFDVLAGAVSGGGGIRYFHTNSTLADSNATGTDSVAIGPVAVAGATSAVAIGNGAQATTAGGVALGAGSADSAVHTGVTSVFGSAAAGAVPGSVVSVGAAGAERQITNVGAGVISATSTDAVNGSQLYGVVQGVNNLANSTLGVFGGTSAYNSTTGAINTTFSYGGQTFTTVQGVLGSIDASISQGAGIKYFHANSTLADSSATGTDALAAGPQAVASGASAVAVGNAANAGGESAVAMGVGASAGAARAVALGANATVTGTGSVALGANSTDGGRENVVSVGSAGAERQVTNLAAGTQATDAVNLSQLRAAQASSVHYDTTTDGTVNTTSVTLNPGGSATTIHNVANGTVSTDAVNVGQLNAGVDRAIGTSRQYTDEVAARLSGSLDSYRKDAYGGAAAAMAVAGLPQPTAPGRTMVAISGSHYSGQTGMAIGLSGVTQNDQWVYKVSGANSTRGAFGFVAAAGYQW